jgi:hypothetical protein
VPPDRPTARLEQCAAGRVRVRFERRHRVPENLERIRAHVRDLSGVEGVEVNHRTGSVLVRCIDLEAVRSAIAEICELLTPAVDEEAKGGTDAIVATVRMADRRLQVLTNGRLSLRLIVPGAFIAFGIRQLLRTGLTVGSVPWYVLLYYGVDTFLKLNPQHAPAAEARVPVRYR